MLRIILAFTGFYFIIFIKPELSIKKTLGVVPFPSLKHWFIIILVISPLLLLFHFYFNKNHVVPTISWFIASCVMAPLIEEFIYRFSVIYILKKYMSDILTIIVSALIFSFAHFLYGNFSFIHLIAGLLLGQIFVYSRSILLTMVIHSLGNLIIGITYYL